MEKGSKKVEAGRRAFLKKSAYVVPTIVGLGYLSNPSSAEAMGLRGDGTVTYNGQNYQYHGDGSTLTIRRG